MRHSFIIIDDETESILKTLSVAARFQNLHFVASASTYEEGVNLILEHQPSLVFLEITPLNKESNLSLRLINELYRYLRVIPKIIVTSSSKELAYEAIKHGAFDYLSKPINGNDVRKMILLHEKSQTLPSLQVTNEKADAAYLKEPDLPILDRKPKAEEIAGKDESQISSSEYNQEPESPAMEEESETKAEAQDLEPPVKVVQFQSEVVNEDKPLIICVKSYGDYRFIEAKDICYLQADNNSTDIHLFNGEMITAFKTLKHFENVLSFPFIRIHNSYIVNIDYVSRIHTGNSVCYIKNTTTKLPFSKSYKENVDAIINSITKGNYLEI